MNKLIAVVGMAGSGKTIATDYLEQKGWNKIYFGGLIYDKMKEENIEITPESQKIFRENLRKQYGMKAVAYLLKEKIEKSYKENNTVLDGLYSWDEYTYLKNEFKNLILICICSDKKLRYNRINNRKSRPFNEKEIIDRDTSEIENLAKGGPIAIADYYILNNKTIEDYEKRLNEILESIEKEGEK